MLQRYNMAQVQGLVMRAERVSVRAIMQGALQW
jgi:predicted nuclease of restriction endonuclease-like RecB superfamily